MFGRLRYLGEAALRPFFSAAVAAAAASLILLLGSHAPSARAQASRTVTLTMREQGPQYLFDPNQLTVPTGQVAFTLVNNGQRPHNFVVPAANFSQPEVPRGQTVQATLNFPTPGTFPFVCDLPGHAERGMRGTITVVAGTAGAAGAAGSSLGATGTTGSQQAGNQSGLAGSTRNTLLFISLVIHVPAAIVWLGLALFDLFVVAVPFLSPAQRGGLLMRPRWLVVGLIPVILLTGIYQTINNPFNTLTDIASLEALRNETTYGFALFLKHGFVIASWVLTLALSFWVAPRLIAFADDTTAGAAKPPRLFDLAAWANFLACGALVLCVTVMIFQLH